MHICQLNYNEDSARMFAALAQNMVDSTLAAGPPQWDSTTGQIRQSYGMCPETSGSICTFTPQGNDHWHVAYEGSEDSAILHRDHVGKFFTGDY